MKKSKVRLYLVSNTAMKKLYEIVTVFGCDEVMYMFDLDEWDLYKDYEWLEFRKKDKSAMECFYASNVMRISFDRKAKKVEKKIDSIGSDNSLKPVPPSTA